MKLPRFFAFGFVALCAGGAVASVSISGSTMTFTVAEGETEVYDQAIPTDGSITTVYKKGKGTMQLMKEGGKSRAMTVYIQEGVLEFYDRNALAAYNNFYISAGAQYCLHSSYASGRGYATICQFIKGVAGSGPDGTGAIRLDSTTNARSCFRNEVTLTGDATFRLDITGSDNEAGFGSDATLNLNGHTLTIDGQSTTLFGKEGGTNPPRIKPGNNGQIIVNTTGNALIYNGATFEGSSANAMTFNQATLLTVEATATFPWTITSGYTGSRAVSIGQQIFTEGTRYLLGGGQTVYTYGGSLKLGGTSQTGAGATLVLCPGAVAVPPATWMPENSAVEEGPIPALFKITSGAVLTNKGVSTWGKANRKIATQCWGAYHQLGSSFFANWNGLGFFGLEEGGRVDYAASGTHLLGQAGSRGLFQQDGGVLTAGLWGCLSRGGRSDYLMRGGTIDMTAQFFLAEEDTAVDKADDFVSFSLVGPGAPVANFKGTIGLNSRTGVTTCVNLDAGRLAVTHLSVPSSTAANPSYLNLNGGTLELPTNAWESFCNHGKTPTMTTVYGGGVTLEVNRAGRSFLSNQGLSTGCNYPLRGARGRGIKSVKLPEGMPRTGYRGIVPVRVENADGDTTGNGAQAALDFNVAEGTIAEDLIILCPGCDYTAAPRIYVYGSDYETVYECEVTLMDEDQVPGALVKTGVGEIVFNSTNNTYAGPYIISNGCLMVNYNARIPTTSKVFVAGGCFRWDWCNRTIAEFGGFGTFFGSRNDSRDTLTVTDRFVVTAEDLNAGRYLSPDQNSDDGVRYAKNDCVAFGPNCKIVIREADQLDRNTDKFVLLKQETAINRLPALETDVPLVRLELYKGNTELRLVREKGTCFFLR